MGAHEYRIIEKMATGSFGVVFKVVRVADNARLVMKRIPLQGLSATERKEAAQEMLVMGGLHHPFVVVQRDAFLFNGNDLCLIMDLYDGGDLDRAIAGQRDRNAYFDFDDVMLWLAQMTLALEYLHSHGIVHRDMKTHNLFLDRRTNSVAVGDFGIAERLDMEKAGAVAAAATWRQQQQQLRQSGQAQRRLSSSSVFSAGRAGTPPLPGDDASRGGSDSPSPTPTPRGASPVRGAGGEGGGAAIKGTPLYMAPEALRSGGGAAAGPLSDVWSLGCILYELLALRHPFESRDIGGLVLRVSRGEREPLPGHYPAAVVELVDRMLTVEPRGRPSCAEILRTPLLRAYLRRLQRRHVPREGPASDAERALAAQMEAFAPGSGDDADHRDFSRQVGPPQASPALEREGVEQRRREAAQRAVANLLRRSSSTHSLLTNALGGTYGSTTTGGGGGGGGLERDESSAGTFFFAGTSPFPFLSGPRDVFTPPSGADAEAAGRLSNNHNNNNHMDHNHFGGGGGRASPPPLTSGRRGSSAARRLELETAAAAVAGGGGGRRRLSETLEDAFFREHPNVADMRGQPLAVIAEAAVTMRLMVQEALRERQRRRDAEGLFSQFGGGLAATMPLTFRGVETQQPPPPPQQQQQLEGREGGGRGMGGGGVEDRSLQRNVAEPSRVALHRAAQFPSLRPYLERRQLLVDGVLRRLSPEAFAAVYGYYRERSVTQRDPQTVRGLVPHRDSWPVLPYIADIVILDVFLDDGGQPHAPPPPLHKI